MTKLITVFSNNIHLPIKQLFYKMKTALKTHIYLFAVNEYSTNDVQLSHTWFFFMNMLPFLTNYCLVT